MKREPAQRINALLNTAEQLGMQGQRRDALDLCDAALTIARAANMDCTRINAQRQNMLASASAANRITIR